MQTSFPCRSTEVLEQVSEFSSVVPAPKMVESTQIKQ